MFSSVIGTLCGFECVFGILHCADLCSHIHIQSACSLVCVTNQSTILLSSNCSYTIKFRTLLLNLFPVTSLGLEQSQKRHVGEMELGSFYVLDFSSFTFADIFLSFFCLSSSFPLISFYLMFSFFLPFVFPEIESLVLFQ